MLTVPWMVVWPMGGGTISRGKSGYGPGIIVYLASEVGVLCRQRLGNRLSAMVTGAGTESDYHSATAGMSSGLPEKITLPNHPAFALSAIP